MANAHKGASDVGSYFVAAVNILEGAPPNAEPNASQGFMSESREATPTPRSVSNLDTQPLGVSHETSQPFIREY